MSATQGYQGINILYPSIVSQMSSTFGITEWKVEEMVDEDDFRTAIDESKKTEYIVARNDRLNLITINFNYTESDWFNKFNAVPVIIIG